MRKKALTTEFVSLSLSGPSETGTKKRTSMYASHPLGLGFSTGGSISEPRHSNSTYQMSSIGHVAADLDKPANGM